MHNLINNKKPLLLVFPHNVMAHYLRCLQISSYLQLYFQIKFLFSPKFHSFIAQAGFETFECEALDAEKVQKGMISFDFTWLNERDLYRIYEGEVKIIKESGAAAVLGDMSPTLKMAAEKTGVQYFSLINGYMSRHYTYVRRIPRSFPLYRFCNDLPATLSNYFISMGEQISFHKIHSPFSKIRKHEGLSSKHSYLQELEGDVNLLCDLPEIFPQKNLPANYYFIPPLYHRVHNNKKITKTDDTKKTLYVSMGSTGDWEKVAFLNHVDYNKYNVVTAGDNNHVIFGSNVFSYPFIDSSELFTIADLVICHGGNGTTYQALSYGIPVLCKTSHCEQEYNADGLERLHLGKSLDDIYHNEDYSLIIEEWIQKKGNTELSFVKKKIEQANNRFEQIIENILTANSAIKITANPNS